LLDVAGTNGISPIFLTTVDVTGGIGLDLKNWVKVLDEKEMLFVMKMVMSF
jgi:aconitate hydratase 2/2-methylisocitrate dehydratase